MTVELKPGVFWVGVRDWQRKVFDGLIPLPLGTTYNSYLVKAGKTALIDTVNPGFENELLDNIAKVTDPASLDYLVMGHAEPDHAGSIPAVMAASEKAVLVTSKKGKEMAMLFYKVPEERIKVVAGGDSLELGGRTLRFIDAPWLHWPETMFTYAVEDKVLFTCDFFGFHTSQAMFDRETDDLIPLAQAYFGEIMMPFRKMGAKAMDRIADLEIGMIAPSHGPVHADPRAILEHYKRWTAGETREKAVVVYVSMWGSTGKMARTVINTLVSEGVEVCAHDLPNADLTHIARDLVDSRAIVLGAPTVIGGLHPAGLNAANLVKALKPPAKYGAFISSYGWSGGAMKQAVEILGPTGIEMVGAHEVKGPPSQDDLAAVEKTAQELARKIIQ